MERLRLGTKFTLIGIVAGIVVAWLFFNTTAGAARAIVALAGTCMEAGKTAAAAAIISRMRHRGLLIDAFKATGVSLRRDILAFEDAGAREIAQRAAHVVLVARV